jgi:hypothetical protein
MMRSQPMLAIPLMPLTGRACVCSCGSSASAFDLPPQILTDLQAFYGDLDEMLNDAEAHHNFLHLTVSNVYDRTQFKKRMNDRLSFAETSILPALDTSIAASEELIKKYSTPD